MRVKWREQTHSDLNIPDHQGKKIPPLVEGAIFREVERILSKRNGSSEGKKGLPPFQPCFPGGIA